MTKKILQQALEALELAVRQNSHDMLMTGEEIRKGESAIEALREALATMDDYVPCYSKSIVEMAQQGEQQPDGLPLVISGAIFDFAGYLTTRPKVIKVGSGANALPMVELIKEWADLRGLSLDDAAIQSWQEWLPTGAAPAPQAQQSDDYMRGFHDGMKEAPTGECWIRVIDEAMVGAHLGVADMADDYGTAKKKLNDLICWSVEIDRESARHAPAALPDWSLLEATQESLCEHMAMVKELQAKLRQGVEIPEPAMKTHGAIDTTERHWFTKDQLQQYGDARDQAGYLRGLETALIKVTGLSVDVERCKQLQLTTQAWEEALDAAANAIEQLKEQP